MLHIAVSLDRASLEKTNDARRRLTTCSDTEIPLFFILTATPASRLNVPILRHPLPRSSPSNSEGDAEQFFRGQPIVTFI